MGADRDKKETFKIQFVQTDNKPFAAWLKDEEGRQVCEVRPWGIWVNPDYKLTIENSEGSTLVNFTRTESAKERDAWQDDGQAKRQGVQES